MSGSILTYILIGATGATLIVLILGVYNLLKGNNSAASNKLMQLRVIFQAIALAILAILLWHGHR